MASKESLFAILSRQPWWVSVAVAAGLFGLAQLALPMMIAGAIAIPFLGIAGYAGWRQLREPKAADLDALLEHVRAMSWEGFASVMREALRRDGYRVEDIDQDPVDFKVDKSSRIAIVSCKRWKAAQSGIGPLRDLFEAKERHDAGDCIYVTTGDFTTNARDFARQKSIRLIEGRALAKLLVPVERAGWKLR